MTKLDGELSDAIAVEKSVTRYWAQVFLRSGQVMWVPDAYDFEVYSEVFQDATAEEGKVPQPEVRGDLVTFFNESGKAIEDIYLPFESVAAVRILTPLQLLEE